ncbi:hypothetical protein KK137_16305 [Croceibacterium sp. LX-88]|jgi:hypothetical protein|uniref:Phage shock protein B n=1 Tax=Croceibacterium selenioxidans TaxID=2838833 RepID=A0ABS5W9J7_9SPHN|nr:hypothetical protein [Croceibacterium selenioxidans]MBT2135900.1 hypothetical protein [Croceibacterium selenioxidans]
MDLANIIFAVTLPIALMSVPIFAIWTQHRRKLVELQGRTAASTAYQELEERTRILERIVTDKGYDVAHQIEALRDQRPMNSQLEDRDSVRVG